MPDDFSIKLSREIRPLQLEIKIVGAEKYSTPIGYATVVGENVILHNTRIKQTIKKDHFYQEQTFKLEDVDAYTVFRALSTNRRPM